MDCNKHLFILNEHVPATLHTFRKMSTDLGSPRVDGLWQASRDEGLHVTKAEVQHVVWSSLPKHVLERCSQVLVIRSAVHLLIVGRWIWLTLATPQLKITGPTLCVSLLFDINTFDRVVYTRDLSTKEPSEVNRKLSRTIEEAPPNPKVIS